MAVLAFASAKGAPGVTTSVLALAFVQYVLHSLNHLIDVGEADPGWLGPANLASLVLTTVLLGWMLQSARQEAGAT